MASYPFEIPADRMEMINRYSNRGRLIIRIEKIHETVDFFGIVRERDLIAVIAQYEDSNNAETLVVLPFTEKGYITAHAAACARARVDGERYDIVDCIDVLALE